MIPAGVFNQGSGAMIMEVRVDAVVGLQASIYTAGTVNVEVDWGDGQKQAVTTAATVSHNYASAGTYFVRITGSMTGWGQNTTNNKAKVFSIQSWGDLGITSLQNGCQAMVNLGYVPPIPPAVTNTVTMFAANTTFNQDISGWDVSNVIIMNGMFNGATSFNQDLSGWCVVNIASEPVNFSNNTPAWTLPKPVWGTCP